MTPLRSNFLNSCQGSFHRSPREKVILQFTDFTKQRSTQCGMPDRKCVRLRFTSVRTVSERKSNPLSQGLTVYQRALRVVKNILCFYSETKKVSFNSLTLSKCWKASWNSAFSISVKMSISQDWPVDIALESPVDLTVQKLKGEERRC